MALNFDMVGLGFHFFVKDEATLGLKKIDEAFKNVSADAEEMYHKTKASLDQMESKFGALGDPRVQATLQKTGLTLMGIGTAGLAMAGMAVKASIDFESAFAGVRKTVDATEEEYAILRRQIREMAKEIPASAEEIASVAEAAGQLGIKKEAIIGFTRVMVDLGVATNMTSDQAATDLARLANITQMPQDQFDRLGSTVVDLGNKLATTESEIVEMGLRLAGAGHQIGLTEAQILSLAGALSSVGIDAEAGGSAMSRVMIEIANAVATGGDQLELFATVAGMTTDQFSKVFKDDAAGAIITFIEGLDKVSKSGVNVFAVLDELGLSEIRMRDALLRAAGAGDLFRRSLEIGVNAWEENTALAREAQERYKTTEAQLQLLRNTVKDIGYTIGDIFLPTVNAAIQKISGFVNLFSKLPAPVQKAIALFLVGGSVLTLFAGAGFLFVSMIPNMVQGMAILKSTLLWTKLEAIGARIATLALQGAMLVVRGATLAWTGAQWLLNAALTANPIWLVIMAVAALTVGIILLARNWDKVTATVSQWWSKLTTWFSGMPAWGKALLAIFMPIIGIPLLIAEHWEQIKSWFAALPGAIIGFIEQIPGFLAELFLEDIPYWISFGIGYMLRMGWEGIQALVGFFTSLPGRVIAFVMDLATQIPIWWTAITDAGVQIISLGIDAIIGFFAALPGMIWSFLVTLPGAIINIGGSLWNAAQQAGSQAVNGMISAISDLPGRIFDILLNVKDNILNFGSKLWDAGKQAFGRLWQGVKEGLGIHSPSYIEQALTSIMEASQVTVARLSADFKRLSSISAEPQVRMAVAPAPARLKLLAGAVSSATIEPPAVPETAGKAVYDVMLGTLPKPPDLTGRATYTATIEPPAKDMLTGQVAIGPATPVHASRMPAPLITPVHAQTYAAPPIVATKTRREPSEVAPAATPQVVTRQPIKLVLDGRTVAETVIEFIEDEQMRRVVPI
ncbi:MAG: hypothetical protein PWR10_1777 [Halanaerobiales bacterium]|nr:hypothetical protein [Halanaerobiales bacterium]